MMNFGMAEDREAIHLRHHDNRLPPSANSLSNALDPSGYMLNSTNEIVCSASISKCRAVYCFKLFCLRFLLLVSHEPSHKDVSSTY